MKAKTIDLDDLVPQTRVTKAVRRGLKDRAAELGMREVEFRRIALTLAATGRLTITQEAQHVAAD